MDELADITSLEKLWVYTNNLHTQLFPNSKLAPIMAGGQLKNPKFMFVFINPTYKNVSSDHAWEGKRRPWTGTKYIWRIFNNAGHFDDVLLDEITKRKTWDVTFADKVYSYLEEHGYYFTNLVKWTGENGDLPDSEKVKSFLPILLREIQLVNPKFIVTFGLIPFNALVKDRLKLKDYYEQSVLNNKLKTYPMRLLNKEFSVIPCYFPVGRGDPKRAADLLRLLP